MNTTIESFCLAPLVGGLLVLGLTACETPTTQRYSVSADNMQTILALGTSGIRVAALAEPSDFDSTCRALGPLRVADGMTHTQYIRRALESELKVAGAAAAGVPRVILSGSVTRLEFSSVRAVTGGSWSIGPSDDGRAAIVTYWLADGTTQAVEIFRADLAETLSALMAVCHVFGEAAPTTPSLGASRPQHAVLVPTEPLHSSLPH